MSIKYCLYKHTATSTGRMKTYMEGSDIADERQRETAQAYA